MLLRHLLIFLKYCTWLLDSHHHLHGPVRDQGSLAGKHQLRLFPGSICLQLLEIPNTQHKGRAMDNQEARGRQPESSSNLNQEQCFFGQGCGQLAVKHRLVNSPKLSMPGESWEPLGLFHFCWAQGRLLAAPSNDKQLKFRGNPTRGLWRTEKRSGLCFSLFLLYPKLFYRWH